tara:strand:- start:4025 stop:4738 length:714 start_codon:yes stop_codon:yes gene_type:complete
MEHHFNVEIAKQLGLNKAVILYNLDYWIQKNRANNNNYFDGEYWTHNSVSAYKELFPYLSEKAIYKALKDLETDGYLITGNYHENKYNRSKWYSLTEKYYCILQNEVIHYPKKENGLVPKGVITTDNKTQIENTNKKQRVQKREYEIPSGINIKSWEEFEVFRKEIKKKLNKSSVARLFKLLLEYDTNEQAEIINNSIMNSWQGLFPLKYKTVKQQTQTDRPLEQTTDFSFGQDIKL